MIQFGPDQAAIVMDNGTGTLKVGYAGEMQPRAIVPMILGRPKHMKLLMDQDAETGLVGDSAHVKRGALYLSYPMQNGIVQNWDDLITIWEHVFNNELRIDPKNHPLLLTETPLNPKVNRERMIEITFEHFNFAASYITTQAILALYASGRTTGLVLDSGEGVTHLVPVFDAFIIPTAIKRLNLAGRDVTNYLKYLLTERGYRFETSCEHEIGRDIKESVCYVAKDFAKECNVVCEMDYRLPDGQLLKIGSERFRAPELMFDPKLAGHEYAGLHRATKDTITACGMDIRKDLWSNVILTGGATMYPGFPERLHNELSRLAPTSVQIRINASSDRKYSVWIGGAVLASLSSFNEMWITRKEYEEYGVNIVHQKCV